VVEENRRGSLGEKDEYDGGYVQKGGTEREKVRWQDGGEKDAVCMHVRGCSRVEAKRRQVPHVIFGTFIIKR
jgi:hypothetical protein